MERMRAAYTALLTAFPLCFGFVKRHAEQEIRHGDIELANNVYEDAVVLGSHCVELWSFYVAHAATHWKKPEDIRDLFGTTSPPPIPHLSPVCLSHVPLVSVRFLSGPHVCLCHTLTREWSCPARTATQWTHCSMSNGRTHHTSPRHCCNHHRTRLHPVLTPC